jgi:hypothetical protein
MQLPQNARRRGTVPGNPHPARKPGLSAMPDDIAGSLSTRDLVAYLTSLRPYLRRSEAPARTFSCRLWPAA